MFCKHRRYIETVLKQTLELGEGSPFEVFKYSATVFSVFSTELVEV